MVDVLFFLMTPFVIRLIALGCERPATEPALEWLLAGMNPHVMS